MKNLKKMLAIGTMFLTLLMASNNAYAGLLLSDLVGGGNEPVKCQETQKSDWSVVVTGITSVVVTGLTSVVVTDFTSVIVTDLTARNNGCAVIIHD